MFKFKALLPFIILIIVMVIIAPLSYIWALNTVFPTLAIPYSIETWIAMVLLHSFFHTSISLRK